MAKLSRLHVAIVDEELPYPANSGKRLRSLNLLLPLARRHRIAYLAYPHYDAAETNDAVGFLRAHGIEVLLVDRRVPPKTGLGFYFRLLKNLLSSLPYSVQVHNSRAMQYAIHRYAESQTVDLWQCECSFYAESVGRVVRKPWVPIAHNVESLIWQRYYETETNVLRRWFIMRQWHKFERFERRMFSKATCVVTVSDTDARIATSQFGAPRVTVVENGVDVAAYTYNGQLRVPNHILFLGSLDWRPNLDAVAILLDRIFPAVLVAEPSAKLLIAGRKPPAWLIERVRTCANVELHADMPDVRPLLWQCGVMAVPLRIAGGSRLKILEALAAECPVVSTRIGAEGLCLVAGQHFVEAESVDTMSHCLIECLRNPQSALKTARLGRQVVVDRYDWSGLAAKLERLWYHCSATTPAN